MENIIITFIGCTAVLLLDSPEINSIFHYTLRPYVSCSSFRSIASKESPYKPTQHSFVRRTSDGRFFWIFGCPMDIRSVSEWDVGRPTDVQDVIQIPPE